MHILYIHVKIFELYSENTLGFLCAFAALHEIVLSDFDFAKTIRLSAQADQAVYQAYSLRFPQAPVIILQSSPNRHPLQLVNLEATCMTPPA